MANLTVVNKLELGLALTKPTYPHTVNALIREAIERAEKLVDVHYALSAYTDNLKEANRCVVRMLEDEEEGEG